MEKFLTIVFGVLLVFSLAAADQSALPLVKAASLTKSGLTVRIPDGAVAKPGAMSDEIWTKAGTGDLLEVRPSIDSELDAEGYVKEQKDDELMKFVDEVTSESTDSSYTYIYRYKVGAGNPVIAIIKVAQIGDTVYTCKGTTGSAQVAWTFRNICDSMKRPCPVPQASIRGLYLCV